MLTNSEIDHGRPFDWSRVSKAYAKYRDIYPLEFYERIIKLGLCTKGQRILDMGTGTGVLPRNLYKYGADFIGADISRNQIEEARRISQEAGMNIRYIVSSAEDIDFPDKTFDAVTACQCFMYFDRKTVLPKIHKMLKDNGYFCIMFMAWLPDESDIAKRSEELIFKYNPSWTGSGMQRYVPSAPEGTDGLFAVQEAASFDMNVTFTRESWHGRIKACRGIGASSLSNDEISAFEKEYIEYLNSVPEAFSILHYATILKLSKLNENP